MVSESERYRGHVVAQSLRGAEGCRCCRKRDRAKRGRCSWRDIIPTAPGSQISDPASVARAEATATSTTSCSATKLDSIGPQKYIQYTNIIVAQRNPRNSALIRYQPHASIPYMTRPLAQRSLSIHAISLTQPIIARQPVGIPRVQISTAYEP